MGKVLLKSPNWFRVCPKWRLPLGRVRLFCQKDLRIKQRFRAIRTYRLCEQPDDMKQRSVRADDTADVACCGLRGWSLS